MKPSFHSLYCVTAFGLSLFSGQAGAAIMVTRTAAIQAAAYTVSSTDLVNNGAATLGSISSTYTAYSGYNPSIGAINNGANNMMLPSNLTGFSVTFNLNTASATNGYDITGFNTYSYSGDFRAAQEYKVYYQTIAGGDTWFQLLSPDSTTDRPGAFQSNFDTTPGHLYGTTNYHPFAPATGYTIVNAAITGWTGVKTIQFVTQIPSGNSVGQASIVSEFDVFGTASPIPEPASVVLLVLGGTLILRRRS